MRDRSARRNHSPAAEQFRREHERHRAWGLHRRHAERLRRTRTHDEAESVAAAPAYSPALRGNTTEVAIASGAVRSAARPPEHNTCT
ncbi:hypothetical protein, partial [Actinoplanes campanulatus]|uniref:hypothetical protein n=1 Tax=Actinoplanes campanulatus TaxID=113559 RepID=UPI0019434F2C